MQNVSFVKGVPEFENPENVPTLILLHDFMDSTYSTNLANYLPKDSIILIFF